MDFMPEGPSIVILKEESNRFLGKTITRVEGNATIDKDRLLGQRIEAIRSRRLRAHPDMLACDALLDQDIFAGVGNIIKNEVLFRIRVHPMSTVGALPAPKLRALLAEALQYSFDFFEWKKAFVLKKHWLAHTRRSCPRCKIPLLKAHLGKTHRRSFFCERCQVRYE
jgi:endonuclease-8